MATPCKGLHVRGRPEPGTGAAVPVPEHLGHRDHASVADRAVGDVRVVMAAIGLFVMRLLIARPLIRSVEGVSAAGRCRSLFGVLRSLGLIAIPVYLDFSTANDSLRSVFDLTALVPLFRVTAFGRAIVDLEVCFALFCLAAGVALWVDRPERQRRSLAELIASCGALLAAAAVLIVPGAAGHAAQTSPRA